MYKRLKKLRMELNLTQQEFSSKIGVSRSNIGKYESGISEPSSAVLSLICREFNVNENWLRNGTEPMYIQPSSFSLDKFVKDHGGTDLELETMKAYFELDPDIRKMLVQHFKERLTAARDEPVEQTMSAKKEDAEAVYIKSRSGNVQKTAQSVLNTTVDMEPNTIRKISNE